MTHFRLDSEHSVRIPCEQISLDGNLFIPSNAHGTVLFVHGSGSSRYSTRNRHVAKILNDAGFATLLFDLLTSDEEAIDTYTRELRFDIELLAARLVIITNWIVQQSEIPKSIGYFGASTGGGAALVAAAKLSTKIKAVVSRGGRPDLAGDALKQVKAPTLLIVGGDDEIVIELNQNAMTKMRCETKLEIISGATHLFEEPGKLDEVARLAKNWFLQHL